MQEYTYILPIGVKVLWIAVILHPDEIEQFS